MVNVGRRVGAPARRRAARRDRRSTPSSRRARRDRRCKLRGRFNRENAIGAALAARALGVDDEAIRGGIESVDGVPGRFEAIDEGQPFTVIVDYAHTPDSLENVIRAARGLGEGRLVGRVRRRRRPRPCQAPADGAGRRGARRPRDPHLRQPALARIPRRSRRRSPPARSARSRSSSTARAAIELALERGAARRRRRDRRPRRRARAGARRRQGAVRRPGGRPGALRRRSPA